MKLEEIRSIKNQRPFMPFLVRTADGREFRVSHPDAIAWSDESPRIVICGLPGGGWQMLDVALITGLVVPDPAQTN
jgi:hypothetical protein